MGYDLINLGSKVGSSSTIVAEAMLWLLAVGIKPLLALILLQ